VFCFCTFDSRFSPDGVLLIKSVQDKPAALFFQVPFFRGLNKKAPDEWKRYHDHDTISFSISTEELSLIQALATEMTGCGGYRCGWFVGFFVSPVSYKKDRVFQIFKGSGNSSILLNFGKVFLFSLLGRTSSFSRWSNFSVETNQIEKW